MSLLFTKRELTGLASLIPSRLPANAKKVTRDSSMQSSVKWACLRLRADLISTTPLDVYREFGGLLVPRETPEVLRSPDGKSDLSEWMYSSQIDLDDCGNMFGLITARDRLGYPARIELVSASKVTVRQINGVTTWMVNGEEVPEADLWHERQFTVPGSPLGLSPTAYAALSLSGGLGAAEFAASWFSGNAIPAAHLKNNAKTLNTAEASAVKAKFVETVATGDVFVTGNDWEYSVLGAKASESAFIDMLKASAQDLCRFYGVPGDAVDVEATSGSITYANVTQRNLQLLIHNLGPAFTRRERTFTNRLTPRGQVVKFNTDAMLRMDPMGRTDLQAKAIGTRRMTVSEARALENLPPLTPEQEAEFARLFPTRAQTQGVNP